MLARLALRVCAVEALKGATRIGQNVLDSQIGALDVAADGSLRTDQEKPFISVYAEDSETVGQERVEIRGLHKSGRADMVIELGIAATMTVTDPETGVSEVVPGIPATDRAFEFYLDCVGREIVNALTDPRNEWAEIWRALTSSVVKVKRRRASDGEDGGRIAAHQITITVDLLPDPVFGEPVAPTSVWARLFAKMEAAGHKYLPDMQGLIGLTDGVLDHEAIRRRRGMTLDELRALLDIAVEPAEGTEPDIQSVMVERHGL